MSALETYQRAVVTLAFAEDDAPHAHMPGFEIYRELIRSRLFAMARVAYARSFEVAGMEACFSRYLAEEPPASPLIREVIAAFGPFAERDFVGPAWLGSMLRFEAAKWRVANLPYEARAAEELDFSGALVVNTTLLALPLEYTVSEEELNAEPHTLLLYRRPEEDRVLWSRLPRLAQLLADGMDAHTLDARVQKFFADGHETADAEGLTRLADELTLAVDRGILLGVQLVP